MLMSATKRNFRQTCAGIDWYCEQSGQGPDVVLIPSGEGDCSGFDRVAELLAQSFRVTTFDTPGFSRSGGPSDPAEISTATLAQQIAGLVRSLGIGPATFYGCSSGGLAALDMAVDHGELVRNVVVHEVALAATETEELPPFLAAVLGKDDRTIVEVLSQLYATLLNEDEERWRALGADYHSRLEGNYVTWVRRYIEGVAHKPIDPATLTGLPIFWSIGGLSMVAPYYSNIVVSHRAGIELKMLPCRHFPQVSIPDLLAAHIAACASTAPSLD